MVTRYTAPPGRRVKSRANRTRRWMEAIAQAQSPRRRLTLACQFAQSVGATLPPELADSLADRIVQDVHEWSRADDDAE